MMHARFAFIHDGAYRPITQGGIRVAPIRPKVGYGRARSGSLVHVLDGVGCSVEGGRLIYAARWLCLGHAPNIILIADIESMSLCSRCFDRAAGPVVYRCYAGDHLLYIGSTGTRQARMAGHANTSSWWPRVTRTEYQDFPSLHAARAAEAIAIRTEKPSENQALVNVAVA